jgi:hypothetical protein
MFCRGGKRTVKRAELYRFFLVATKYCPAPMPFVFCGEWRTIDLENEKHSFFHFDITAQSKTLFLIRPLRFMSASGTKRTFLFALHMSAFGVKRTRTFALQMSAYTQTWHGQTVPRVELFCGCSFPSKAIGAIMLPAEQSRHEIALITGNLARRGRKRLDKSTEEIEAAVVKVGNNAASLAKELQAKRAWRRSAVHAPCACP